MKFPIIVAITCMTCKAFAAETNVRVEDKDLPRVPATEPTHAISTFQIRDGFRMELAASEPAIASPVAMAFDEDNRMFVVEMRDYSERRDEKLGRVKLLEDRDADGHFETARIFAEDLAWPTAIICYDGGVFVGASPDILYLKDTDQDGTADVRKVIFTGFGGDAAKLNVQQLLNSFTWGLDNRIHGALGGNPGTITNRMRPDAKPLALRGRDFSFDPRMYDLRPESGGGQWGMSFDDEGNKFICSNSRHIAVEMYDDQYAGRSRYYSMRPPDANIAVDGPAAEVFRLSPDEPWRVLRTKWRVAGLVPGPVEGGGRASGYFTGAAAVTIYRGDAFPEEFRGDAFVADCGSNLIHRKKIRRTGLDFIAERPADEQRKEFLASRDNWFRPVAMANGPDGTLYVADMYREVVEHPWSLPPELKSRIDLNSGNDRGRIYRVVPKDFQRRTPVRLGGVSSSDLVNRLGHSNGWHRDTIARLLVQRNDPAVVPLLRATLHGSSSSQARLHALHLIESLGGLEPDDVLTVSRLTNAAVRVRAVQVADAERRRNINAPRAAAWRSTVEKLSHDDDVRVRFQSALVETNAVTLARLIERDVEEEWMRGAVLSGLSDGAAHVFATLAGTRDFVERKGAVEFLREASRIAGASAPPGGLRLDLQVAARSPYALMFANALAAGLESRGLALANVDAKTFGQLQARAEATATNSAAPDSARIEAVELLSTSRDSRSQAVLWQLLQPAVSAPLQTAAVLAMTKIRPAAASNVLANWAQLAPATRSRSAAVFAGRRQTALALLDAVEQGTVQRSELAATEVQRLTTHQDSAVRTKARKVLQRPPSERLSVVEKFRPALDLKGDAQRGHAVYLQRCASCHRAGEQGFAVGPDLASVASGGKEKLLTSILDPNAEVAAASIAYAIETRTGDSFLGVLASDNPLAVLLKLPSGDSARVLRENIISMRASGQSLMPEGLEEGLSPQDMSDLLEFAMHAKPGP